MNKTIQDIKNEIELINETGLEKLLEKGVVVSGAPSITGTKPPTTLDIVNAISLIETDGSTEEQEKIVNITENGTTEILPDNNKTLSKVTVITDVNNNENEFNILKSATIIERTDAIFDWRGRPDCNVTYVQQEDDIGEFPLIIAGGTYRVTLDGVTKEFVMQKKAEINSNSDRYEFQLGNMAVKNGEGDDGDYYIIFFDNSDDRDFEFGIKTTDDTHNFKIEYIHKGEISLVSSLDDLALNDEDAPENGHYLKNPKMLISAEQDFACKINVNGLVVEKTNKNFTFTDDEKYITTIKYFGNMSLLGMDDNTGEQYLVALVGGSMIVAFSPEIIVADFKLDFLGLVEPTEIDILEDLIDNSGVLEDTEGSVSEKVEQLIDLVEENTLPDWDDDSPIIATGMGKNKYVTWELTEKGTFRWKRVNGITGQNGYYNIAGWDNNTVRIYLTPLDYLAIAPKIRQFDVQEGFTVTQLIYAPNCERIRVPNSITSIMTTGLYGMKYLDFSWRIDMTTSGIFSSWYWLEEYVVPPNAVTLSNNAFQFCYSLKNIDLENITTFNAYCLSECTSLDKDIVFNENLITIKDNAFYASGIKSVQFQNSTDNLPTISSSAFSQCRALTDVYCPWSEGEVANAPWGATNATIHYNYVEGEETNADS